MGVALALLSSVVWGVSDFVGGTLSRRLRLTTVVGGSETFGLIALVVVTVLAGRVDWTTAYVGWSLLGGVAGLVGILAFYRALSTGTMGVVAPVAALGVAIPVLLGFAEGNRPSALQDVGLVVGVVGVVLAGGPELRSDSGRGGSGPLLLAGLSAVCFGAYYVALDRGAQSSTLMSLMLMRLVSVVLLVAGVLVLRARARRTAGSGARPVGVGASRPARRDVAVLVLIGCLDVSANGLYAASTRHGLLAVVSVLSSLYPAVTVVLAREVHGERLSRSQIGGVAAAIAGIALLAAG